jgi:photosystem II stability/assembly factor-like uncharacterized protein
VSEKRSVWAGAMLSVLGGAGLLLVGSLASAAPSVAPVVSGTAHQALFAVSAHGDAAIAVGAAGAILESGDAGKSWKAVTPAPTPLSLLGVSVQQGHAIAVGQEGTVLVMDDAGKWAKSTSGTDNRLFAVSVNSGGRAVAVGAFGTAIKSEDGGASWASIAPDWTSYTKDGEQPHLYDVNVDEKGVVTMVGEFGLVVRSADGGKTWKTLHQGDASLFALYLPEDGAAYAAGQNGALIRSADHGATWSNVDAGTMAILLGVHAAGDKVVVTGLHDMLLSNDDGNSWTHLRSEEINTTWYQGVAGAGAGASQTVLAVGHSGEIIRVAD